MEKPKQFPYSVGRARVVTRIPGYYVWDTSAIYADHAYHMFVSRWKEEYGFGANWLFNSEIVHCVAKDPAGPYQFQNVVLPKRGPQYFDGMDTHNTCIREYKGKYYLYYMGTTFNGPNYHGDASEERYRLYNLEVWNRKRIGLAIADNINGPFKRFDEPLLSPRDCSHWDCTITTNPAVTILPDGRTYMIYKSRSSCEAPLQLGVAYAEKPDGPFKRVAEGPLFDFDMEDPFLWYDAKRKKFCLLAKDSPTQAKGAITGFWGAGFYAESDDCIHFEIAENPLAYKRDVIWEDGRETTQGNLERPSILFDENGNPIYLYVASRDGSNPYSFKSATYVIGMPLERK